MKLSWLTDTHINFLDDKERLRFYQNIVDSDGVAVLITGDIAEAEFTAYYLNEMADQIKRPIYFVLGNHDYYRGSAPTINAIPWN